MSANDPKQTLGMRFTFIFLVAAMPCVSRSATCAEDVQALRDMLAEQPEVLAKANAEKGDLTFLKWGGVASLVPGVDQKCATAKGNYKWMRGASTDVICGGKEHGVLHSKAMRYAQRYNVAMATERASRGLAACR